MSKKRAFANREQKKRYIRFVRVQRSTVLLLATCLSFFAVCLLMADQLFRPDSFSIDELKIRGTFKHLQPQEVELVVINRARGNFFAINLDEIRHEVEKLKWVQSADIRREWPDTLLVNIVEHRPVMRWGESKWVNTQGKVVELGAGEFIDKPIVLRGDEKDARLIMQKVMFWSRDLDTLGLSIREASLSSTHAWKLKLKKTYSDEQQSTELLLGRRDVEQRFTRFIEMYKNSFQFMDINLHKVDARYPNGLAVTQTKKLESEKELLGNLDKSS